MAPILPYLTDSPSRLRETVAAIAESGARSISPIVLHLRPGAREWYVSWLAENHPDLVERYRTLYRGGSYALKRYQGQITEQVVKYAREFGIGRDREGRDAGEGPRRISRPPKPTPAPAPATHEQLRLL
jgi:DNA repair photolyase